jgi:hypothetical protein
MCTAWFDSSNSTKCILKFNMQSVNFKDNLFKDDISYIMSQWWDQTYYRIVTSEVINEQCFWFLNVWKTKVWKTDRQTKRKPSSGFTYRRLKNCYFFLETYITLNLSSFNVIMSFILIDCVFTEFWSWDWIHFKKSSLYL